MTVGLVSFPTKGSDEAWFDIRIDDNLRSDMYLFSFYSSRGRMAMVGGAAWRPVQGCPGEVRNYREREGGQEMV